MALPKVFLSCGVCKASGSGPLSNNADDTGVVIVTSNTKKAGFLLPPSSGNDTCAICLGPLWKDANMPHGQEDEPFASAPVISNGELPPVQLATTRGEIPRSVALLDCEHIFHVACIAPVIQASERDHTEAKCPICRAKIEDWDVSSIMGVYNARKAIETPAQRGSPPSAIPRHMQTPQPPGLGRQDSFFIVTPEQRPGLTPEEEDRYVGHLERRRERRRARARAEPGPSGTFTPDQVAARQRRLEQMLADVDSLPNDDNWADNVQDLSDEDDPGALPTLEQQTADEDEDPGGFQQVVDGGFEAEPEPDVVWR